MELSRLAVRLRPRGGWEAMDLGFHMARTWWRPVWGTWCAVFVPTALLLHLLFWEYPGIAMAITWWLKPVFDRFVLHVVSRAVFGVPPGVRETLGAWRQVLSPGLFAALTLQRFSLARSFTLAVPQLEHQTGAAGRARRNALGRRLRGYAIWLTSTCSFFELFVILSVGIGLQLLAPGAQSEGLDFERLFAGRGEEGAWSWTNSVPWCIAIAAIEPFYVCAGFALYLNRRAILEGWDIELQLRRLDERLSRPAATLAAALFAAVLLAFVLPEPAHAQDRSAREEVREVLKAPELVPWREEMRWQFRRDPEKDPKPRRDGPAWGEFGRFIASLAQALAWIAAALLVAAVLYYLVRYVRARLAESRGDDWKPPEALFGLAVAPESLPDDVAAAAAALAREGRVREALSLLYRGALSALVHRERVRLVEGDTEADTLVAAKRVLPRPAADYFGSLVGAWIAAAYAGRLPDTEGAVALAGGWASHFAPPRAEARA